MLIFRGNKCHAGAGLARNATAASVGAHLYIGAGITDEILTNVFTDESCR